MTQLEDFKDKHKGERIFIIGTGPSLNETPLEELKDEFTMSLNRIDLKYEDTSWRPTYYVYYDVVYYGEDLEKNIKESVENHIDQGITSFIAEPGKELFGEKENVYYFDYNHSNNAEKRKNAIESGELDSIWSDDITDKIYNFGSTIAVCAQIASYMGFEEIYFVGCDLYDESTDGLLFKDAMSPVEQELDSSSQVGMFYELIMKSSTPLKSATNAIYYKLYHYLPDQLKRDENHFTDKYAPNQQYTAREWNKKLGDTHKVIKIAGDKFDFKTYNATIGGYLEVHPRVDLEEIL